MRSAPTQCNEKTRLTAAAARRSAASGRWRREECDDRALEARRPTATGGYTLARCWERSSLEVPPKERLCTVGFARPVDVDCCDAPAFGADATVTSSSSSDRVFPRRRCVHRV
ncbi:hypothetical protein MTO96_049627 [Rhipicephalus appendiculatus]